MRRLAILWLAILAWDLGIGNAWDLWLENSGLGSLAWYLKLGIFGLGSWCLDLWLGRWSDAGVGIGMLRGIPSLSAN